MLRELLERQDSTDTSCSSLEQMKVLMEALKAACGDDDDSGGEMQKKKEKEKKATNKKISSNLRLLYTASKVKIYKIADKIEFCVASKDEELRAESEVEIPVAASWNFKLGDNVKIKYSLQEFKSIQSRTLGWNARLRTVHGCIGIVTRRNSCYENSVAVYMPARLSTSSLYAGLLEKLSPENHDDPVFSRWKVDEYVTTKMDIKVVQTMQRRLDTIPREYLGRKGRIIAVTRVAVVVTFNERESYDINSYLLMRCPDQTPIYEAPIVNPRGLKAGDRVKLLSNLKKLIANQKDNGGWSSSMSNLVGKEVTIIHVRDDGTINVQYKLGRSWRVNSNSVMKLDEVSQETKEKDVEYVRGDIVKIRVVENIRMLFEAKNIPLVFLEYLRSTAEVKLVDDDHDYLIRYNCDQNVSVYAQTVRRATSEEVERHNKIKRMEKEIGVNSQVYLDVGPPNFVHAMLTEVSASHEVIRAMTSPAILVGFAEDNRAVIEYKDGCRYKIKKKFLTVPDKFNVNCEIKGLDFEVVKEIQEMVATCVQILHEKDQVENMGCQDAVKILSLSYGTPSTVDLRVISMTATCEKICELLIQLCEWNVEIICAGTFYISGIKSIPLKVKVKLSLYFNDEDYIPQRIKAKIELRSDPQIQNDPVCKQQEHGASEAFAAPIDGRQEDRPNVKKLKEFSYLRLYHPSLARNVYFPYIVHGQQRRVQDAAADDDADRRERGITLINCDIGNMNVNKD